MKNIFEILSEQNITVTDEQKSVINKAVSENYKTIAEVEKTKQRLEVERDNYKDQLEGAQTALKEFEGIDVKDLQGKLTTLQNDLAAKETDYQNKLADMEFNALLDRAISASGAKSGRALRGFLDIESLKSSKNQSEDIKQALETVKKDNDYLFTSAEPFKNSVGRTTTTPVTGITKETFAKMGYGERVNLKKTNPEKYNELKGD